MSYRTAFLSFYLLLDIYFSCCKIAIEEITNRVTYAETSDRNKLNTSLLTKG